MRKLWSEEAWDDYVCWQDEDRKTLRKINNLLKSIDRNGYDCASHLEMLRGNLSGTYSIHIDKKNRLVFSISNDTIEILQCGSHYGDK